MALQNLLIQLSNHSIEHELPLPHDIHLDGVVHRYCAQPQQYKRDKDEWYIAHELGSHLVCTYGTWKNGGQHYTYRSWKDSDISPEELKRLKEELAEHQKQVQREEAEAHKAAAERAHDIWSQSTPCESHGYLEKKGVKAHFAREYQGMLVIPIYDAETDELQSLQFIGDDSTKRFLKGGRTQNGYAILGSWQKDVSIAEGFATAATVHETTSRTVIIAFSANNLARVALHIKKRQKAHTTALLQDLGDAGEKVAEQWQQHQLGDVFKPSWGKDEPKSDWNDLAQDKGAEEVARQLAPRRFPTLSLSSFMSLDHKEPEWVVENLFTQGSVNMIYAQDGLGKSMVALDLMMAIGQGRPFWNRATKQSKCLLVDGEMANWELAHRLRNHAQRHINHPSYLPDGEGPQIVTSQMLEENGMPHINLYNPIHRKMMEPMIEEADFIVLDNIFCLTQRSTDDNYRIDQSEWEGFITWARGYKNQGKTFLMVHHTNKSGEMALSGSIRIQMQTLMKLDHVAPKFPNPDGDLAMHVTLPKTRYITGKEKLPFIAVMYNDTPDRDKPIPNWGLPGGWEIHAYQSEEYRNAYNMK